VHVRICRGPGWATTPAYPAQEPVTPRARKSPEPVVNAWPDLPEAIRAGIVAVVKAAPREVGGA